MAFQLETEAEFRERILRRLDELGAGQQNNNFVNGTINQDRRLGGIETKAGATQVPYPLWMPIRDYGNVSLQTVAIDLNRIDSHISKMTVTGAISIGYLLTPPVTSGIVFYLDIKMDAVGGHVITWPANQTPVPFVDTSPNARTIVQVATYDAGVTFTTLSTVSGGSGIVPPGTTENDHLEWNNTTKLWERKQILEFGVGVGLHAETGFLNFLNNTVGVAWRNAADTGDLQIKANLVDEFEITNVANGPVTLTINAQHASQADQLLKIYQFAGTSGSSFLSAPTLMQFQIGATDIFRYDLSGVDLQVGLFMGGNVINEVPAIVGSTVTNVFDDTATGWDYKVALGHEHDFFVDTVSKLRIGSEVDLGADLDVTSFNIKSTSTPTAGNQFRVVFDAHDDSDTFISNSTTADRINVFSNNVNILAFRPTDVLMGIKLVMNTFDIETVGNLSFGSGSPTTGRIRIPNTASIKWESVAAGNPGELLFDVDEKFFWAVPTGGAFGLWIGGFLTAEINTAGLDMQLNTISNVRNIVVHSSSTIAGFRDIGETADPTGPLAGEMYYNTTSNEYRFYNGTSWIAMGSGGSSNSISQGNSNVTVTDAGTGVIEFTADAILVASMDSGDVTFFKQLIMSGAGFVMNDQNIANANRIEFSTTGTSSSVTPRISASTTEMIFSLPANDDWSFYSAGTKKFTIEDDATLQWQESGRQHRISVGSTGISILAETTSDSVTLWTGTSRTNPNVSIEDLITHFENSTSAVAYEVSIKRTNAVTTGQPTIGAYGFYAEDSVNVQSAYGGLAGFIEDDTSTGRDGNLALFVASNTGTANRSLLSLSAIGIQLRSQAGVLQLGFFGATPAAKPTGVAVTAAGIHAALVTLGLIAA